MKRIFLLVAILCSLSVSAQRVYRIDGIPQRFVNALGIPINPASYYNNTSDSAIIFFDPSDTSTISFKYKGLAKKLAASRISWDSITGKPSNYSTTYALSNDIQDSIQNRVRYTGAVTNVNLGEFRLSSRSVATDSIIARSSAGGRVVSNSGTSIATYGAGGGSEFVFNGFAGYNANRSSSYIARSFTDKGYVDSADGLRLLKADSLSGGYTSWLLTKKKIDSLGLVISTADALKKNIADTFFTTGYTTRGRTKQVIDSLGAVKYGGTVTTNTIPLASGSTTLANSTITQSASGGRIQIGGAADDGSTRVIVSGSQSISTFLTVGGIRTNIPDGAGVDFNPNISSTTSSNSSAVVAFVNDGTNNRRAGLFVDNTNALWGLSANQSANAIPFVIRLNGAERFRIATDGLITSNGSATIGGGMTAQRGRFTSLVLNKDSIPITTSNFWALQVDTSGTPYTNRINRRDISATHTGSISFDTSSRTLTINQLSGNTTSVVIPRGTASGTSGITVLSSTRTGNLVTVMGDNGSSTIFSVRDADSSAALQSLTAGNGLTGSPYNGGSPLTWTVDTVAISTKANVAGALVAKLNISDTAAMLSNYARKSGTAFTGGISGTTASFNDNVRVAENKIFGLRATTNEYSLQSRDLDFRLIGSNDAVTQRLFSFGYYNSNDITGTWNNKLSINSYTGELLGSNAKYSGGVTATDYIYTGSGIITFDQNNTGVQDFRIRNGANSTLLLLNNLGNLTASGTIKSAGLIQPIFIKTANYTLTANDHTVIFDVSGGNRTATLPAGVEEQIYIIKVRRGSASNTVTITPNGSETINATTSYILQSCFGETVTIQFLGGNWEVLHFSQTGSCL